MGKKVKKEVEYAIMASELDGSGIPIREDFPSEMRKFAHCAKNFAAINSDNNKEYRQIIQSAVKNYGLHPNDVQARMQKWVKTSYSWQDSWAFVSKKNEV